mmetsp:Transcript_25034/g.56789  ORF Transcript_25034/g.56789 Transcript_25034/m.56789 type:complete len:264 (+) Transcript_25034:272-1063(+)
MGQRDRDAKGHLDQLQHRHEQAPPWRSRANGCQEVIRVHNGMHTVIHRHKMQTCRHLPDERVIAVEQHRGVVIPMQEVDRLLPQDEESCVDELKVLREDEDKYPEPGGPVAVGGKRNPAQSPLKAEVVQEHHEVGHRSERAQYGEHREKEVPGYKALLQAKRLPGFHGHLSGPQCEEVERHRGIAHPPDLSAEQGPHRASELQLRAERIHVVRQGLPPQERVWTMQREVYPGKPVIIRLSKQLRQLPVRPVRVEKRRVLPERL